MRLTNRSLAGICSITFAIISNVHSFTAPPSIKSHKLDRKLYSSKDENEKQYQGNKGRNWIERSTPTGISTSLTNNDKDTEFVEYTLQLDGDSFDLGLLSQRIYNALLKVGSKRYDNVERIPQDILQIYKVTTMNIAAKEATKLALEQNNLQLVIPDSDEMDDTNWGLIDTIQISNIEYTSIEEAINLGLWEPGNTFSFLVRNVIAKEKEMDMKELLKTLDPNGRIQQELDRRVDMPDDPTERVLCLKDLKEDNERRCNSVPLDADAEDIIYDDKVVEKNVISFERICDAWHGKDDKAYGKIMQSLESNSFIVVSLNEENSNVLKSMWDTVHDFFHGMEEKDLPSMDVIPEAGSKKAVVGYASYDEDSMQFLETRLERMKEDVTLYPKGIFDTKEDTEKLQDSFKLLSKVGKYITQIAIDASNQESNIPEKKAKEYAKKVVQDLLDDGCYTDADDTKVCMSPHRLCRYSYPKKNDTSKAKEIFGAHTDTSFVTIIPCASVSGLEVFNEDIHEWVRPESIAKQHYQKQNPSKNDWYTNYVIILPGELLQLMTRSMIVSSIHRVISIKDVGKSRVSAPILLRARCNKVMDVEEYFGSVDDGAEISFLLDDCEDMSMEEIHDALQP